MISKIYNCISIHNGGGIVYLSMMHKEIDRKGNLILLDYRAKNHLLPFLHAEIKFFKRNIFRNLFVLRERIYYTHLFSKFSKSSHRMAILFTVLIRRFVKKILPFFHAMRGPPVMYLSFTKTTSNSSC